MVACRERIEVRKGIAKVREFPWGIIGFNGSRIDHYEIRTMVKCMCPN